MAAMRVHETAKLVLNNCKVRCFRALEHIDSVTSDRFLKLQDAALQQCHETDESDLNRLRKHFKTLKNTFTVYDLKEGFIDGTPQSLCVRNRPVKAKARWSHASDMQMTQCQTA